MQQILALSRCAVIVRHWFEIDLDDASMEHGARIELRELVPQQHRGSESAAQIVTGPGRSPRKTPANSSAWLTRW